MAHLAPIVAPHIRGLIGLNVTDEDVLGLEPPILLFYGRGSVQFVMVTADRIRTLRPDLRIVSVGKARHNVHRDRPDIVNAEALAFLDASET